jgi:hypothetical protein
VIVADEYGIALLIVGVLLLVYWAGEVTGHTRLIGAVMMSFGAAFGLLRFAIDPGITLLALVALILASIAEDAACQAKLDGERMLETLDTDQIRTACERLRVAATDLALADARRAAMSDDDQGRDRATYAVMLRRAEVQLAFEGLARVTPGWWTS